MRPNPFRITSDDRIPLVSWAVLMANYNGHELRMAPGWLELSASSLRRVIDVNLSGTDSPYSELKVMAKFHLQDAQY